MNSELRYILNHHHDYYFYGLVEIYLYAKRTLKSLLFFRCWMAKIDWILTFWLFNAEFTLHAIETMRSRQEGKLVNTRVIRMRLIGFHSLSSMRWCCLMWWINWRTFVRLVGCHLCINKHILVDQITYLYDVHADVIETLIASDIHILSLSVGGSEEIKLFFNFSCRWQQEFFYRVFFFLSISWNQVISLSLHH